MQVASYTCMGPACDPIVLAQISVFDPGLCCCAWFCSKSWRAIASAHAGCCVQLFRAYRQ